MDQYQLIHSLIRFDDQARVVMRFEGKSYDIDNLIAVPSTTGRPDTIMLVPQSENPSSNFNRRILDFAYQSNSNNATDISASTEG